MEEHKKIIFENRQLHYRDEGREHTTTLVMLHGFLQNLTVWSSYTLTYMLHMRVITIDLPGHGYSANYSDVHTMDFMANAVKAVLDDAGVEQCVMAGHSMGGYVALAFAEKYPFMLRGLVLLHSHGMVDSEAVRAKREETCRQVRQNRAGYIVDFITRLFDESKREYLNREINELCEECLLTSAEGIIAAQRGMKLRTSKLHVLAATENPVLFIYGKKDPRIPVEVGVSHALLPKRSELLLLDGVGHMSFLEERDYVKRRIHYFVNQCYRQ